FAERSPITPATRSPARAGGWTSYHPPSARPASGAHHPSARRRRLPPRRRSERPLSTVQSSVQSAAQPAVQSAGRSVSHPSPALVAQTPGAPVGAHIASFSYYLPEQVITNAELARMVDTSDEWILE